VTTVPHLILGASLAGLSASFHRGHRQCVILERKSHAFGHLASEELDGFTWDEGPHVSFTVHDYVKDLFAESVGRSFLDYPAAVGNWFHGHWIDHPAQSNLYQAPKNIREESVASFLNSRPSADQSIPAPENYGEWLEQAFGPVFAEHFPRPYTRKYWTVEPELLGTDWVGGRVFRPAVDDVLKGSEGPLDRPTHYIKTVRYPERGGYQAFVEGLAEGADVRLNRAVVSIDLGSRIVTTADGQEWHYQNLINTLPLPVFVSLCRQSTDEMKNAALSLACSQLLLVNVTAPHPTRRPEHWLYVYDEDMLSTRINFTESLSPQNAPPGHTGIQVEVYSSRFRPLPGDDEFIRRKVVDELVEMKLLDGEMRENATAFIRRVDWANVIFTRETASLLEVIWSGLEAHGLVRESDDLLPLTLWNEQVPQPIGSLVMAGRFGQWKYFWTDDCVLRGKQIAERC
jgi:protoporphyrinogen oxidase